MSPTAADAGPEVTAWTLARERVPGRDGLPLTYQTFIVKLNGVPVGEVRYSRRPKSCGGPAWMGRAYPTRVEHGTGVTVYDRDRAKVLRWFKDGTVPLDPGSVAAARRRA